MAHLNQTVPTLLAPTLSPAERLFDAFQTNLTERRQNNLFAGTTVTEQGAWDVADIYAALNTLTRPMGWEVDLPDCRVHERTDGLADIGVYFTPVYDA